MSSSPASRKKRSGRLVTRVLSGIMTFVFGLIITVGVFALLPFMQMLGEMDQKRNQELRSVGVVEPPPPQDLDIEEPPPPEDEQPEEAPDMEPPADATPDLNALADALAGGAGGGGSAILSNALAEGLKGRVGEAFSSGGNDVKPRATQQVPPKFPVALAKQGASGVVTLEFVVDPNGRVTSPRVVESSNSGFNAAALEAIKQWRFEPGQRGGRKVPYKMRLPMRFEAK